MKDDRSNDSYVCETKLELIIHDIACKTKLEFRIVRPRSYGPGELASCDSHICMIRQHEGIRKKSYMDFVLVKHNCVFANPNTNVSSPTTNVSSPTKCVFSTNKNLPSPDTDVPSPDKIRSHFR